MVNQDPRLLESVFVIEMSPLEEALLAIGFTSTDLRDRSDLWPLVNS